MDGAMYPVEEKEPKVPHHILTRCHIFGRSVVTARGLLVQSSGGGKETNQELEMSRGASRVLLGP